MISHHIQYRVELEQTILGMCMLENGYARIADYLVPANFSDADLDKGILVSHKTIYEAMGKLYPTRPINLISVATGPGWGLYCARIVSCVSSASDIRYHAGQLLEFSIRDAFLNLLNELSEAGNDRTKLAIHEITDEALDYDNDLFQLVDKAAEHLLTTGCRAAAERVAQFSTSIDTKARNIKRLASIDTLMNNLSNINRTANDWPTQTAITHLTDLIKQVLSKPTLTQPELANILKASI